MSKKLHISDDLKLPVDWITLATVVYGARGSGKTSFGRVAAEEATKAGQRFCAIDLKGDWYGLKSSANGKGDGIPVVVFGGEHADVPLEPDAGKFIGETIAKMGQSSILDFELLSKGKQIRFLGDFFEALYHHNREPLLVLADEAQRYCLSDDTEILSKRGWLRWNEIGIGELVCCFDLENEGYSFGPVSNVLVREHDGQMVALSSDSIDCLCTPDHRVVLHRTQRAKGRAKKHYPWTFCSAAEVPTCIGIPAGGAPVGAGLDDLSVVECRILGWLITDGCLQWANGKRKSDHNFRLAQAHSTTKLGVVQAREWSVILDRLPDVQRYERGSRKGPKGGGPSFDWYFGAESSARFAKWLGVDMHRIPRTILNSASADQLRALMRGLLEGDGTSEKGKWTKFYPGKNSDLADDFQELALRLGMRTTKRWVESQGQWHVSLRGGAKHWVRSRKETRYKGTVWDVTVPTGAFVARRNGKIFVTGNCPQKPGPDEARTLGAVQDAVKLGRKHGLGLVLFTQRGAGLNKEVSELCDMMVAFRTPGPLDQERVKDWLDANTTAAQRAIVMTQISGLDTGTAMFASGHPDLKVFGVYPVRRPETFDSSATPKVGQVRAEPKKLAKPDLDELRTKMAAAIERAKADDPKALRAEIAALKAKANVKPMVMAPATTITVTNDVPTFDEQEFGALHENICRQYDAIVERAKAAKMAVGEALVGYRSRQQAAVKAAPKRIAATAPAARASQSSVTRAPLQSSAGQRLSELGNSGLSRMLLCLAQAGSDGLTPSQMAMRSHIARRGGTFRTYLSAGKTKGWIEGGADRLRATEAGLLALGPFEERSGSPLQEWLADLGESGAGRMLRVLANAGAAGCTREQLAIEANVELSGGSFRTYFSKLKTLELATENDGVVRADVELFE